MGVAMLSSVLNSERAIQVNIQIIRSFVRIRQLLATNEKLARKLQDLEKKYDTQFQQEFRVIAKLMVAEVDPKCWQVSPESDHGMSRSARRRRDHGSGPNGDFATISSRNPSVRSIAPPLSIDPEKADDH